MLLIVLLSCCIGALAAPNGGYKIIGGEDASEGEFPYIVAVQLRSTGLISLECGGVIINENWILSAGHCTAYMNYLAPQIVAGTIKLSAENKQVIDIEKYITHPGFNISNTPYEHDIVLFKLKSPLEFNDLVQPGVLPKQDEEVEVADALFSGWGVTDDGPLANSSDILQKATLPVVAYDDCLDILKQTHYKIPEYNNTIVCTGPLSGGRGPCFGDSGGPLVQNGVVIGLSSWVSKGCAHEGSVAVLTKVSPHINWIKQTIHENT